MFQFGQNVHKDDHKTGQPSTSTDDDNAEKVLAVVCENRRLTVHEVSEEVGISISLCHTILTEKLEMQHHDNASAHTSLLVHEFLVKHETTVVPQPPYSPELAPAYFFCTQS
jgi:hypothetical protein